MNKIVLIGRLTKDPELRQTPNGVSCCRFTVAVERSYTRADGEKKTDFFNCTAWRAIGENLANYKKKGDQIALTGSVETREYTDNNGINHATVDVIADNVEFLATAKANANGEPSAPSAPAPKKKARLVPFDDVDGDAPF